MPHPYQPTLTSRDHAWRLALMLATTAFLFVGLATTPWIGRGAWLAVDAALAVVAFVIIHYRRSAPLLIPAVVVVIGSVSMLAFCASMLAIVSVATSRRLNVVIPFAFLTLVTFEVSSAVQNNSTAPRWADLFWNVAITVTLTAIGLYIGSQRELKWRLRERAETAEREQSMRVAQARLIERERIAREMHDVLAHRISLVSMHAGALAFRTDLAEPEVRDAAAVISDNANQAMTDLRSVLGVLRDDDPESRGQKIPQPTFDSIDELLAEARDTGMSVDFEPVVQTEPPMPRATGRTVYRIVQELLTNARKHAPHTRLHLHVTGDESSGVSIEATNPIPAGPAAPTPESGFGLIGMRERVELAGGSLDYHRTAQTFRLSAWVPWLT